MRQYQKGKKRVMDIKKKLAEIGPDLLSTDGTQKKISPKQLQHFMESLKKLPSSPQSKDKKVKNPIKIITKKHVEKFFFQNDNEESIF